MHRWRAEVAKTNWRDRVNMKIFCLVMCAIASLTLKAEPLDYAYVSIGFADSGDTRALGINSSGTVLIQSLTPGSYYSTYLWNNGVAVLVAVPFTVAFTGGGINDYGAITGNGGTLPGSSAFILDSSGLTQFQFSANSHTNANGINDSGTVVGYYAFSGVSSHGYERSPTGILTTIDVPNSPFTEAQAINNRGDIVGTYLNSGDEQVHGFLLRNGVFSDVMFPQDFTTEPNGINDLGNIVGYYTDSMSNVHGFLLAGDTYSTFDVPGAFFTTPLGINDSGSIVGLYGTEVGNREVFEGFIATPVPEPRSFGLCAVCVMLLGILSRLIVVRASGRFRLRISSLN